MSPSLRFDVAVIGAGVVGLALARHFARQGRLTALLESAATFGTGISARNSEVVHAGIYYPTGSLKARLCAAGNAQLYAYCAERGIAHRRLGKLIVATRDEELPILEHYRHQATANNVTGLVALDATELRATEPALRGVGALLSPSTGIVDSHGLMAALLDDFEQAGGIFARQSPVLHGKVGAGGTVLHVSGRDPCAITAPIVVNAAGLGAQRIAHNLSGFPTDRIPPLHYAIGHYYRLTSPPPFRHLVYPVAAAGGLGIHLTLDLAGQARFGPDISWRDSEDYAFDPSRQAAFGAAIRRYWPDLADEQLEPGYTGIRPKLWGPSRPEQDFLIQTASEHGIPGLINLFGIESPGLTAALALAEYIGNATERNLSP